MRIRKEKRVVRVCVCVKFFKEKNFEKKLLAGFRPRSGFKFTLFLNIFYCLFRLSPLLF